MLNQRLNLTVLIELSKKPFEQSEQKSANRVFDALAFDAKFAPKKFHLSLVTPDAALPTFDQITKKGNESEDEDDEN